MLANETSEEGQVKKCASPRLDDDRSRHISALTSVLSGCVRSALTAEQRLAIESSLRDLRSSANLGGGESRHGGTEDGHTEKSGVGSKAVCEATTAERPICGGDPKGGSRADSGGKAKDRPGLGGTLKGTKEKGIIMSPRCDSRSNEDGVSGDKPAEQEQRDRKKGMKKPWSERFRELCEFKRLYGHARVCHSHKVSPQLATWVKRQRQEYQRRKRGRPNAMTDDKIKKFEEIGFCWEPRNQSEKGSNPQRQWMSRLEELRHYKFMKGDVNIKQSDGPLGRWVDFQRRDYKKKQERGRRSQMTDIRKELLEDLGFTWEAPKISPSEHKWNQRLSELDAYKEESGTLDIPPDFNNRQLVYWVDRQRLELLNNRMVVERGKGKPTYLTEAKKTALQNLGFHMRKEPSLPLAEHLWMDRLEELEIFREENGHANVPTKYPPNPALVCTYSISCLCVGLRLMQSLTHDMSSLSFSLCVRCRG